MNTLTVLHNIQVTANVVLLCSDSFRRTNLLPIFTVKDNTADSAFGDALDVITGAMPPEHPPTEVYVTLYTPETSIVSRAWLITDGVRRVIA